MVKCKPENLTARCTRKKAAEKDFQLVEEN